MSLKLRKIEKLVSKLLYFKNMENVIGDLQTLRLKEKDFDDQINKLKDDELYYRK